MENARSRNTLSQKVLVHLYNSAVAGVLRSTALALGAGSSGSARNHRLIDVQRLLELVEGDRRLFYGAAAAIAEFAVYCTLDFVENYNRFDSQYNEEEYPHLSLSYMNKYSGGVESVTLSQYGSEELGRLFKLIARSDEMRLLIESTIDKLITK